MLYFFARLTHISRMIVDSNPPLAQHYNKLLARDENSRKSALHNCGTVKSDDGIQDCCFDELPSIDLSGLTSDDEKERVKCMKEIAKASSEWGFFQVVNHGISVKLLKEMRAEQINLFNSSFFKKSTSGILNNSYRWGTPTAISPEHFSWSEAFHIPLTMVSDQSCYGELDSLRGVLVEYAEAMQRLGKLLAGVLVMNLSNNREVLEEMNISCNDSTCFLRLNRYPICPISSPPHQNIYGLVPHTDSDFLTILHQDHVGGLQLMKDSRWVAVKPNQDALIVNIGDLFQAWSNDVYKSVEHKVMANATMERFSAAYFLCPSYDSFIGSCKQPSLYRNFTFGEYRNRVQEDTKTIGRKIGLPRFRC